MGNSIERYLYDEIKSYKKKINEREKEKTQILNKPLEQYQINILIETEKDFITYYKNKIEERKMIIKDGDFLYNADLLISNNIMKDTHIHFILNAYLKLQNFKDAKIDTKSYSAIKRENSDTPDSPSIIRKALTEELRFANYSSNNVRDIMKVVIGRASKSAQKQDEKTEDGRTIHITQFLSSIE